LAHGEAATVFADPLALTYHDPDHSLSEERFITVGMSRNGRVLIVAHSDRGENIRIISARKTTLHENIMKKTTRRRKPTDELRSKYTTRYQAGTNLMLLSPDVAEYFPDEQSVNTLIHVTKVKKIS
jgi:uncharacterized DUF497 family protein